MSTAIEIIKLGPKGDLFQICDGERFGLLEFDAAHPGDGAQRLQHPHVIAYLSRWLNEHGVLTGSQNPPRLEWVHVEMAVVAARA